ncbi:MAG: hypothetical protein PHE83_12610 [Opitutaceae bacterium]|nr:hypothetical protein [Opitutaceae bacterium]
MPTLAENRPVATRRRYWVPGLSQNPDTRSIQVGLIWTVLVHLLLLLLAPELLREEFSPGRFVRPGTSARTFDIEISPDLFQPKAAPTPDRFVETNPDANNNIPDNTTNFAAQNQQAAQPEPDKNSTLHMPKTEGQKDVQNDSQIVTGQLQKPELNKPSPPMQQQQAVEARPGEAQRKQEVPLPGYLKSSGSNQDAFGTEAVKLPEPSTGADTYVQGDKNAQSPAGSGVQASPEVRPEPMPRPRLTQVRPGILQERQTGVSNAGVIGVDAHFSQFGDYLQELIDIVQIKWDGILGSSRVSPARSHVLISFRLNSQGEIAEILKVEGDAGDYGTNAALSAIREPAPYRPWTKEMVAVLGNDQVITFNFHYW